MQRNYHHRIAHDRSALELLLVGRDGELHAKMRQVLAELGFGRVTAVTSHIMALDRLLSRQYDIVLFDARPTNMPPDQFVKQVMRIAPSVILVALSDDPSFDDVFSMLRNGARGYLRLPMSVAQVEQVLLSAASASPFNKAILESTDRNRALAAMILNCLFRLTESMRHSRQYLDNAAEIEKQRRLFHDSVNLARTFSNGGDLMLRDKICEECCFRAEGASSRLGRARIRLRKQREALVL